MDLGTVNQVPVAAARQTSYVTSIWSFYHDAQRGTALRVATFQPTPTYVYQVAAFSHMKEKGAAKPVNLSLVGTSQIAPSTPSTGISNSFWS